jgi:hypothetical protein
MAVLGKLPMSKRAGHDLLAWNPPSPVGADTPAPSSPDFGGEEAIR